LCRIMLNGVAWTLIQGEQFHSYRLSGNST
jgi:hypothetical protein